MPAYTFDLTLVVSGEDHAQMMNNITEVQVAVAKSELTSFTPILAKIAVSAAKKAENKA